MTTTNNAGTRPMTAEEKKVIFASSLGTVFEWYDFYLFGSLALFISKHFFSAVNPTAAFIFTLLGFAAGFAVRPFGALFFGRLGDLVGRKYTFLITILIMGLSTTAVGLIPSYASWGIIAPIILITLRLAQGLALGGEYGGAATYVAEHAPPGRRGYYTSWIQTTATLGLFLSLLVILGIREYMGETAFAAWGWRIPFILSIILLVISVWIRLSLSESPVFLRMKEQGKRSKSPLKDSFAKWPNLRLVLIALFGLTAGEGVVWYAGQFYALFFLMQTLKVGGATAQILIAIALALGTPFFVFFGWLSDRIGRKSIILAGFLIAALVYFPVFKGLTHFTNPALETAMASSPVTVISAPGDCSFQFNPAGTAKFTKSCDVAVSALAKAGITFTRQAAPPGTPAQIKVGDKVINSYDATGLAKDVAAAKDKAFGAQLGTAIKAAGYPDKADPAQMNKPMIILLLFILVVLVTMVYGPIAAILTEMFPTNIRYTSMSLPYHIGNGWFGGFLPAIAFAIVAATGNIYAGLWYPIIVAVLGLIVGLIFVKDTRHVDINR